MPPTTSLLVGNRVLDKVQLGILAKGNALYLPENDRPASRHLLYCMADFTRNKLLVSGEPFPIRTYRVKGRYPASCQSARKKYRRSERLPVNPPAGKYHNLSGYKEI
mgnify:CR=1 FL=1